jgi:hypothetical protein
MTMRFDLGISRTQFLLAYRERRRISLVNSTTLALRARDCMAGVYQDAEVWRKASAATLASGCRPTRWQPLARRGDAEAPVLD